jgi:hypothetical protein
MTVDSTKVDSISTHTENIIRLSKNLLIKQNPFYYDFDDFSFNKQSFFMEFLSYNRMKISKDIALDMLPSLYYSDNYLEFALKEQYKWRTENKLGIMGEILTYLNIAATGYLLYEHFRRYKEDYKRDFK